MSEQSRTAPRWQDVPESHAGDLCGSLADRRDAALLEARHCEDGSWWRARAEAAEAALARLAEPAQSSAATTSSPCARCGHAWHEHVDRDSDNACQANGCPCARWYGGAQSSTPAAPAQPSAAERWRAVPAEAKDRIALRLESMRVKASLYDRRDDAAAADALLALAREAEGT